MPERIFGCKSTESNSRYERRFDSDWGAESTKRGQDIDGSTDVDAHMGPHDLGFPDWDVEAKPQHDSALTCRVSQTSIPAAELSQSGRFQSSSCCFRSHTFRNIWSELKAVAAVRVLRLRANRLRRRDHLDWLVDPSHGYRTDCR